MAPPAITLAPHPDPGVHPLAYQRMRRRNQRLAAAAAAGEEADAEEASEDEGGPGCWGCWLGGKLGMLVMCNNRLGALLAGLLQAWMVVADSKPRHVRVLQLFCHMHPY